MKTSDVILYGAKGGAKMVLDSVQNNALINVIGIVDSILPKNSAFYGKNIIGSEKDLDFIFNEICNNIILTFTAKDNLSLREEAIEKLIRIGFDFPNVISNKASIEPSVKIGKGNFIGNNVYIGSDSNIGSWNFFNPNSIICHDVSIGNNNHFSTGSTISGYVNILNNCSFGLNTGVKSGIKIISDFRLDDFENLI